MLNQWTGRDRGRSRVWIRAASVWVAAATFAPAAEVTLLRNTVIDPRGTTMASTATYGRAINGLSFQGQALTSFKGYQYAIFYVTEPATAPAAHIAIGRRKLPDGAWQVIDLRGSVLTNGVKKGTDEPFDAHNTASIGICPNDGTIHIAYDHHNHPLRYRRSKPGAASDPDSVTWDASLFAPETVELIEGKAVDRVSYPDFQRTPAGDLQLFMRRGGSGRGSWWLWNYDAATHRWKDGWQYDDGAIGLYKAFDPPSTQRCAYPNGYTYGPDSRLHISFTWREGFGAAALPGNGCNHDICYVWSPDGGRTWKNNADQTIGAQEAPGGPLRFSLESPGLTVISVSQFESMINEQAQSVDSAGRFHVLMYRLDPRKSAPTPGSSVWRTADCTYDHAWRDQNGTWHESRIPAVVGSRPKLAFDHNDSAYAIFTNGPTPGIRGIDRQLVVATASKASNWTDWKVAFTLPGPVIGEPLLDQSLMQSDGILSVLLQDSPTQERQTTPIRVVDFAIGTKP